MKSNYPKAYVEVIEILKYMPKESVDKIPKEILTAFEAKKDKNYRFIVDETKNFEEQIVLDETKAILANIFRDYWANQRQKQIIINKQKNDREKLEEQKRLKYNDKDIFKNKKENIEENNQEVSLIPVQESSIFSKIKNFFRRLLRRS